MRGKHWQRQAALRQFYRDGWEILSAWAHCACEPGRCPLAGEMEHLGFTPGDLLAALALGRPALIGVDLWEAP